MDDIKDILNMMKFVPADMQDEVLKNIKKGIEKEINKSCNPIDLLIQRLKELKFGEEENSYQDKKIIRIISKCMPIDWFYMEPIYCESKTKTKKYDNWTEHWKVNEEYEKFIKEEIKDAKRRDDDELDIYWLVREIAQESNNKHIDVIEDSYWIYKDGANWETWLNTTKQLANEMISWFECCFSKNDEDDVESAYEILNKLEENFPKKE